MLLASSGLREVESAGDAKPSGPQGVERRTSPRELPAARGMFRIFRYFSIASFVCIVVAATSLTAFFRYVAIREIVEFGEYTNASLAEASLNSVRPATLEFLARTSRAAPENLAAVPLPPILKKEIDDLMQVRSVVKIKIYNPFGWVAYSTELAEVGHNQSDNVGVRSALAGYITSKLIYRDAFNAFDGKTEEDNLIQTYVPISSGTDQTTRGVFEMYIDVNSRVADIEEAQWQIIGAAVVIMTLLYIALLLVVQYAGKIIDQQQVQIHKHTATLEALSARMLHHQEDEKKKIALELHEGVAQTLSAVKMSVETACRQMSKQVPGNTSPMEPMVQVVKDAIAEVRGVALNLRPSSLDDLGLAATLKWFCREYMLRHKEVQAEYEISVIEESVPEPLKIIIYRVIEETCRAIETLTGITHIRVMLQTEGGNIVLTIDHDWSKALSPLPDEDSSLNGARERALLSGGAYKVATNAWGGRTIRATWLA